MKKMGFLKNKYSYYDSLSRNGSNVKMESVEEYLARGGQIKKLLPSDIAEKEDLKNKEKRKFF